MGTDLHSLVKLVVIVMAVLKVDGNGTFYGNDIHFLKKNQINLEINLNHIHLLLWLVGYLQ
jgi:hypothetical protein